MDEVSEAQGWAPILNDAMKRAVEQSQEEWPPWVIGRTIAFFEALFKVPGIMQPKDLTNYELMLVTKHLTSLYLLLNPEIVKRAREEARFK